MELTGQMVIETLDEAISQCGNSLSTLRKPDHRFRLNELDNQLNNLYCYLESQREKYRMIEDETYPEPYVDYRSPIIEAMKLNNQTIDSIWTIKAYDPDYKNSSQREIDFRSHFKDIQGVNYRVDSERLLFEYEVETEDFIYYGCEHNSKIEVAVRSRKVS